jgi:hypothetical protein
VRDLALGSVARRAGSTHQADSSENNMIAVLANHKTRCESTRFAHDANAASPTRADHSMA